MRQFMELKDYEKVLSQTFANGVTLGVIIGLATGFGICFIIGYNL